MTETYLNILSILNNFDLVVNIIFMIEFLIKIVAKGFVIDKGSYLRDNWNRLDLGILILAILTLTIKEYNLSFLKVIFSIKYLLDHSSHKNSDAVAIYHF